MPQPRDVSVRKSAGNPCSICGTAIEAGDLECQLEYADALVLRLHIACYVRSFRQSLGIGGGSADSPWTMLFDRRIALTARRSEVALSEFLVVCREVLRAVRETRLRARRVHAQTRAALARLTSLPE